MSETIFICRRCEQNLEVGHLDQPVLECPVCGWAPSDRRLPAKKDEAEPTPAEKLAMLICELQMDVAELRYRLDGSRPSPERAQRWKRTLAIVEAALGEKRQQD